MKLLTISLLLIATMLIATPAHAQAACWTETGISGGEYSQSQGCFEYGNGSFSTNLLPAETWNYTIAGWQYYNGAWFASGSIGVQYWCPFPTTVWFLTNALWKVTISVHAIDPETYEDLGPVAFHERTWPDFGSPDEASHEETDSPFCSVGFTHGGTY